MCLFPSLAGDKFLASNRLSLALLSIVALLSAVLGILPFPVVGPIQGLGLVPLVLVLPANLLPVWKTIAVLVAGIVSSRSYGCTLPSVVIYAGIFLWFFSLSGWPGGCW